MTTLELQKHHGLGNDFLVAFHPPVPETQLPALTVAVCDRRTGIGADGLLIGESDPHHSSRMVLYNADGSRAEMSGNGIRCFAHALAIRRGDLDVGAPLTKGTMALSINTDVGAREVVLATTEDPLTLLATVDMGDVSDLGEPAGWSRLGADPGRPAAHLSLGNPHSVVPVEDVTDVDLAPLGRKLPDVNLEIIAAGPTPDSITMRVHERGAGITMACGTGACAAAVAARRWGLAAPHDGKLVVHMDGGSASVSFDPEHARRVSLTGPTTFVGTVHIPNVASSRPTIRPDHTGATTTVS